jgi:hypothetical protein
MSAQALPPPLPRLHLPPSRPPPPPPPIQTPPPLPNEEKKAAPNGPNGPNGAAGPRGPPMNKIKDETFPILDEIFKQVHLQLFEGTFYEHRDKHTMTAQYSSCPADLPFDTIRQYWNQWHAKMKCDLDCQLFGISVTTQAWGITVHASVPGTDKLKKMIITRQREINQLTEKLDVLNLLADKYESLYDQRVCSVCLDRESNVMLNPCHHVTLCSFCISNPVSYKVCPRCSHPVTSHVILKFAA